MSSGIRPNLNGLTVGNGHSGVSSNGPLKLTNVTSARSNYSGRTYNPRAIQEMIISESMKAGVNPRVMLMKVDIETGGTFDPWARNVLVKLRRTLLSENFHTPMGSSHCWLYAAV